MKIYFQADAGILDLQDFNIGDYLINGDLSSHRGIIAPELDVFKNNIDFWVCGAGECPDCGYDNWAKIIIKNGKFDSIRQTNKPDNPFSWAKI